MLRLIIKLVVSPLAVISMFCNLLISILLWDERGFKNSTLLLDIIWSENEGMFGNNRDE